MLQLLSGLPPVPEILRLSGVCMDEALVPAVASLTVPRATPRATFNQGVQVIHVLLVHCEVCMNYCTYI